MAVRTRKIELALATFVEVGTLGPQGAKSRIVRRCNRLATRLQGDVGAERQQPLTFRRQRFGHAFERVGQRMLRAGGRQILLATLLPTLGALSLMVGDDCVIESSED